ncbi:MAG: T9SS type A sorting domain-containing protein [Saprospiraceae bacterium]|nr:T9SS type A sorting domain-containing protein [Saprospiraceae bacterium]NNL93712.1 T9SS type A sorting domain-containing protein [Saprospiraceae bacterium]
MFKLRALLTIVFLINSLLQGQDRTVGLLHYDSTVTEGYTLFSPMASTQTYLIDNCGEKIKEWTFNNLPGLYGRLLEDGSIIKAERRGGSFGAGGSGGGIAHQSWDGEQIWSFQYSDEKVRQHHDFEYLPNGNVLLLAWERKTLEESEALGRISSSINPNGVWFEQVVEIKPIGIDSGEIVWKWHITDHLVQDNIDTLDNFQNIAESPEKLNINYRVFNTNAPLQPGNPDWLHFNAISYHEAADLILISSRNTNEVYIIDHSTTTEEAKTGIGGNFNKGGDFLFRWGNNAVFNKDIEENRFLYNQHHVNWMNPSSTDDLTFSIFNNGLNRPGGTVSSVEILTPYVENGAFILSETGIYEPLVIETFLDTEDIGFTSPRLSSAQILDNGNFLIASGNFGEIFEVSKEGEILWLYHVPVNNIGPITQGENSTTTDIFRAEKYSENFDAFTNRDLTPLGEIELIPLPNLCLDSTSVSILEDDSFKIKIFPNPTTQIVTIEADKFINFRAEVFDFNGKQLDKINCSHQGKLNLQNLNSGIYIIKVITGNKEKMYKIVKE